MRFIDSNLPSDSTMHGTAKEQAKSGLRLGLGIGLFLIAGMLLGNGMQRVVWSASPPHYLIWPEPIGWLELVGGATILLSTAGVWWQLLAGAMVLGAVKSLVVLFTGRDMFAPHAPFPHVQALELLIFATVSVALMARLRKNPLAAMDRVALTVYLFSFMWHGDQVEFSAATPGLALALFALLVPRLVHWRMADKKDSAG